MRNKKQYRNDLWLFIGSITVLVYILFMNYISLKNWDNTFLRGVLEFVTIPMILLACAIPMIVVYRFISKKTDSRTLSMMAVLVSLMTGFLISYLTIS